MAKPQPSPFSRREREVMEILYRLGEGAVADVAALMAEPTSYDAVRLTLGALADKGHARHRRDGKRYIYRPTVPVTAAWRSAFQQLTRTYFRGSPHEAVLALLDASAHRLSDEELEDIAAWIRNAKEDQK